jgi:hypothetical protein
MKRQKKFETYEEHEEHAMNQKLNQWYRSNFIDRKAWRDRAWNIRTKYIQMEKHVVDFMNWTQKLLTLTQVFEVVKDRLIQNKQ